MTQRGGPQSIDWDKYKFISWPSSHGNPFIRVPLPSGRYIIKSVKRHADESITLQRCIALRDSIGVQLWGMVRWNEILMAATRSVAKHRRNPASSVTGVYHYHAKGRSPVWIVCWYEPKMASDGSMVTKNGKIVRRKNSRQLSYGTEKTSYRTSQEAFDEAVRIRREEEQRWYSVLGKHEDRRINEK